jgi:uncharacterized membrane-anchored protein
MGWIKLTDRMPKSDEHDRVLMSEALERVIAEQQKEIDRLRLMGKIL